MKRIAALICLLASPAAAQDIVVHYTLEEAQAQADADNFAIKGLGYPASQTIGPLISKLLDAVKAAKDAKTPPPPKPPGTKP